MGVNAKLFPFALVGYRKKKTGSLVTFYRKKSHCSQVIKICVVNFDFRGSNPRPQRQWKAGTATSLELAARETGTCSAFHELRSLQVSWCHTHIVFI